MKKTTFFLILLLSFTVSFFVTGQTIRDRLTTIPQNDLKIGGYVGERTDQILEKRVRAQDWDYLVEPFRHHEETHLWQMEFWGKWMLGAVAAWEYYHDPVLMDHMSKAVTALIATQLPNGYIGNYAPEAQLTNWDIWGRKYVLLGLLRYHDITGSEEALQAARKEADYLLSQTGPGKVNIIETGNYKGMASSAVLEPIMMLYNKTGDERYLSYARYIVNQWETPGGPQLISKALAGIHVADRFPHPDSWFSPENGQKAYEMMSCYNGLLELYKVTGEKQYLKAVEITVRDIMEEEINVAGSGSAFECWYHGRSKQTIPTYHMMETCVLVTWMKLNYDLLKITGKPVYANNIETSWYNALLASTKYGGTDIQMYSPLVGHRGNTARQCGMDINCCSANGPRGYMLIPRYAVMTGSNEIFINLYAPLTASFTISGATRLKLIQETGYPKEGSIRIRVEPEKAVQTTLVLRIPAWSQKTILSVNGKEIQNIEPGTYRKIKRTWKKGDQVDLVLDMRGRLLRRDHYTAVLRGPIVLARYSEFNDGFVDEAALLIQQYGYVELTPDEGNKPEGIWMSFTAKARLGTGISSTNGPPSTIHLCDFGTAGDTWSPDTRYRVWLPEPLDVRKAPENL